MQNEISSEYPELPIKILSINQIGAENGIESFNETHALPMVNDNTNDEIWVQWESQWRDFYILNKQNVQTKRSQPLKLAQTNFEVHSKQNQHQQSDWRTL